MDTQNKQNWLATILLALMSFIAGAAIAWVIKPAQVVIANPETNQQEQIESTATTADDSPTDAQASSSEQSSSNGQSSSETQTGGSGDSSQTSAPDNTTNQQGTSSTSANSDINVQEDGQYSTKDEVALYIHNFGHLPSNYISKSKAKKAGWVPEQGNLWEVLPGMSIGGSEFYNNEGMLPDAPGRVWTECDINYQGGYRGAERIVFSNDGLIFYTADHYESFEQLY